MAAEVFDRLHRTLQHPNRQQPRLATQSIGAWASVRAVQHVIRDHAYLAAVLRCIFGLARLRPPAFQPARLWHGSMPCQRPGKSLKSFKPEPNPSELNMRNGTCQVALEDRLIWASSAHQAKPAEKPALPVGRRGCWLRKMFSYSARMKFDLPQRRREEGCIGLSFSATLRRILICFEGSAQ